MPLMKAQCTNCNGILEIDEGKDAAICPYCGAAYIVEKAIQQYITNNQTINKIENAVIQSGFTEKKYLENGITQLKIDRYEDALETFRKMSIEYPSNWKAWLGKSISECGESHSHYASYVANNTLESHAEDYLYASNNLSIINEKSINLFPQDIRDKIGNGKVFWEDVFIHENQKKIDNSKKKVDEAKQVITRNEFSIVLAETDSKKINENIKSCNIEIEDAVTAVSFREMKRLLGKVLIGMGVIAIIVNVIILIVSIVLRKPVGSTITVLFLGAVVVFALINIGLILKDKDSLKAAEERLSVSKRKAATWEEQRNNNNAKINRARESIESAKKSIEKCNEDIKQAEQELAEYKTSNKVYKTIDYFVHILEI